MSVQTIAAPAVVTLRSTATVPSTAMARPAADPRLQSPTRRFSLLATLRNAFSWRDAFTPTSAW